ncbi:MAG: hypothetical protein ACN4GG_07935 [Akkermansiaceae bacterium]
MCAKIKVIVNDLKKTQGTDITFANILTSDSKGAKDIKKSKLKGHGIVARDRKGKLIQIVNGHSYGKKEVDAVVAQLLLKKK